MISSGSIEDNSEVISEHCIPASSTHLYTILLRDSWSNSWTPGSYVKIDGKYGNTFFRNMMIHAHLETYTLSLFYPILKGQIWKFSSSSVPTDWSVPSFNDQEWEDFVAGGPISRVNTHYFRYNTSGTKKIVAYEARFLYQFGIIVYVNGNEVFRDNMPSGSVSYETRSISSYATLDFRGFVRPGIEMMNLHNLVAVELHFDSDSKSTEFDCFLAVYGPTTQNQLCYVMTDGVSISVDSPHVTDAPNIFDMNTKSYMTALFDQSMGLEVKYSFSPLRPYLNGLMIYRLRNTGITKFSWDGVKKNGFWSSVIKVDNVEYTEDDCSYVYGFFNSSLYEAYRFYITSGDKNLKIYEVQPLVCEVGVPTNILYSTDLYTALAKYDSVYIQPIVNEFTNCNIYPELPEGVTLNPATCIVSGIPLIAMDATTFHVTSEMEGLMFTGEFTLQVTGCDEILVDVYREYSTHGGREGFEILNLDRNEVVYYMPPFSEQEVNAIVHIYLCLPPAKFQVTMMSPISNWFPLSVFDIRIILDNDYEELVGSGLYDASLGNTMFFFTTEYAIFSREDWYYLMGSVPSDWTNSDMDLFVLGEFDCYPASANAIQLYKKNFYVSNINTRSGFVLSIRYQSGVIVYLNGIEVWRNNVEGDLTTSSLATGGFQNVSYHQVSLPIRTIVTEEFEPVSYIVEGRNTIAIALVANSNIQRNSVFDCALHILSPEPESRIMTDYTIESSNILGNTYVFFKGNSLAEISGISCTNYLDVKFNNDRREWVSSMDLQMSPEVMDNLIQGMVLKARNSESEKWVTLASPTDMTWSILGQRRRIFFVNNKPYNMYRFENFQNEDCRWRMAHIRLYTNPTAADIPSLSYPLSSLNVYRNVEIAELYPMNNYYHSFSAKPSLPEGLILDYYSGMIYGTPLHLSANQSYVISATTYTGSKTSVELSVVVTICYGGESLISLAVMISSYLPYNSYKLYKGKGSDGEVVSSIKAFTGSNQLNYVDFCLPHDIYTLEIINLYTTSYLQDGFYLSIDLGALKFEAGRKSPGVTSLFRSFSSYLPFQINLDYWLVEKFTDQTGKDWTAIDFDDSSWQSLKANTIGTSKLVTIYIRRSFIIPNLDDYQVLNVRMRYTGGVVAYFNGHKVARFNLADDASSSQTSIGLHDPNTFSVFHIILSLVGAVTDHNVIAFEIHRTVTETSSSLITFDASGVFGVNNCSIVLDSYSTMDSSQLNIISLDDVFDLSTISYGTFSAMEGNYIHWMVENMEGSKFNAYLWSTISDYVNWGFSLYGRNSGPNGASNDTKNYILAFKGTNITLVESSRTLFETPLCIVSFNEFRFVIDVTLTSALFFNSHYFFYCKASGGAICDGIDDFPPVMEGQISPAYCPYGYTGYRYRVCENSKLSDIHDELCVLKAPKNLHYKSDSFQFLKDVPSTTDLPSYSNIIDSFFLYGEEQLPSGLSLNPLTGEINGTPLVEIMNKILTIIGQNKEGMTYTRITLNVEQGYCEADSRFVRTKAGESASFLCASLGNYIGVQTRRCKATAMGVEWGKTEGMCVSVLSLVVLIVMIIVMIVLFVILIMRIRKIKMKNASKKLKKVCSKKQQRNV